jgi:hypothetical protein
MKLEYDYEITRNCFVAFFFFSMIAPFVASGNVAVSLVIFVFIWIPVLIGFWRSYLNYKKTNFTSYEKYCFYQHIKNK